VELWNPLLLEYGAKFKTALVQRFQRLVKSPVDLCRAFSVLLATVSTQKNRSRIWLELEPDCRNGFYHTKTQTVPIGPVLPRKTRHLNFTSLAQIEYWSSDHIVTWSMRKLCSVSRSFTSRFQICIQNNIRWVAIENMQISSKILCYSTSIQRILFQLHIWKWDVEEGLILHVLCIDHVTIRSELSTLITAKVAGTIIWNYSLGSTQPKHFWSMSSLGNIPTKTKQVSFSHGSETELNGYSGPNLDHW